MQKWSRLFARSFRRFRPAALLLTKCGSAGLAAIAQTLQRWNGRPATKRPNRRLAGSAPFLAGALSAVVLLQVAVGEDGMRAIAAVARDPASLLADRSPGQRAPGAKFDTKASSRVAHVTAPPSERPADPAAFLAVPDPDAPVSPFSEPTPEDPAAFAAVPISPTPDDGAPASGPRGFVPTSFFPLGSVPPNGGNGGDPDDPDNPGSPGTPTDPDTPPVAAVPEPASWAMIIAGLFGSGWLLRRRRSEARPYRA